MKPAHVNTRPTHAQRAPNARQRAPNARVMSRVDGSNSNDASTWSRIALLKQLINLELGKYITFDECLSDQSYKEMTVIQHAEHRIAAGMDVGEIVPELLVEINELQKRLKVVTKNTERAVSINRSDQPIDQKGRHPGFIECIDHLDGFDGFVDDLNNRDNKRIVSKRQWRKARFNLLIKKMRILRTKQPQSNAPDKTPHDLGRWTKQLPLAKYKELKWLPDIVNVVSLCHLVAVGKTKLPLDLYHIAKTCDGTFYAPSKFAAVQLGIDNPKSRILIFHTGRIVQTGTTSVIAAHNAVSLTLKILRDRAGLMLRACDFSIINMVGAVALNTVFNCSTFADHHTDEVRFDPGNFVGLTWNPVKLDVPIIVEVYSTGRANIPGATREHILYKSFAKIIPELIKYSSASAKAPNHLSEDLQVNDADMHIDEPGEIDFSLDGMLHTEGRLGNVSMRF